MNKLFKSFLVVLLALGLLTACGNDDALEESNDIVEQEDSTEDQNQSDDKEQGEENEDSKDQQDDEATEEGLSKKAEELKETLEAFGADIESIEEIDIDGHVAVLAQGKGIEQDEGYYVAIEQGESPYITQVYKESEEAIKEAKNSIK